MNYTTEEERLRMEFEIFGQIESIRIVKNTSGKSKGYAFIEYRRERDADRALIKADGRRIDGRRVIVDRELGRRKKDWVPRRLGGGKGEARRNKEDEKLVRDIKKSLASPSRSHSPDSNETPLPLEIKDE